MWSRFRSVYISEMKDSKWEKNVNSKFHHWDSNHLDCSLEYIVIPYAGAGGCVGIYDINDLLGKADEYPNGTNVTVIRAHSMSVTDCKFSPFNPGLFSTSSSDSSIRIWRIPEEGLDNVNMDLKEEITLSGHLKSMGNLGWHPTCENVLISSSVDRTVKIWDAEIGVCKIDIQIPNCPLKFDFNDAGNTMVVVDRSKKLYVVDPRTEKKIVEETSIFGSMKGIRVVYMKDKDLALCTGFERGSSRTVKLFEPRNLSKGPIFQKELDLSSGIIMPFYDEDLGIVYLAGKGEGLIRIFDYTEGRSQMLNTYNSMSRQRGLCMTHKLGLDTMDNEIGRFFKLSDDSLIPLQVLYPCKSSNYQPDLYPDTNGMFPSGDPDRFFSGEELSPVKKTSLVPGGRETFPTFRNHDQRGEFALSKDEEERVDTIIELFGDLWVPLANKELNLWKCLMINSTSISLPNLCEIEEFRGLADLNINVEERTILSFLLRKSRRVSIPDDSLLDYFLFFRRLGLHREMKVINGRIRRISSCTVLYIILMRLGVEQHENETIQGWFQSTSPVLTEISIDTFDTSFGLAVFSQLKERYSRNTNQPDVSIKNNSILLQNLENYSNPLNISDHRDFLSMNTSSVDSEVHLFEKLKNLRSTTSNMSNVTLVSTEGRGFPTHKEVLVFRFEYFHSMFRSQWAEKEDLDKQGKVEILDMDNAMLETFLEYMYTENVDECNDFVNLIKLVGIGHKYIDSRLISTCLKKMDGIMEEKQKTEQDHSTIQTIFDLIRLRSICTLLFNNEELLNQYLIPRFVCWSNKRGSGLNLLEWLFRNKVQESYEMMKKVEKLEDEKKELEQKVGHLEERIKLMELEQKADE